MHQAVAMKMAMEPAVHSVAAKDPHIEWEWMLVAANSNRHFPPKPPQVLGNKGVLHFLGRLIDEITLHHHADEVATTPVP